MADIYEHERQSLIQKLHDSVKQCQVSFGGKTTLATEADSSVVFVITHFEQVLLHGLKRNKVWEKITSIPEPILQVTQKMLPEMEPTYWSLLKEYLGQLDVQHFQNLSGITSDAGRARVWLRVAINEHSLESHLNSIIAHASLRRQFYETWALMMDEERVNTIPTMARGLCSILFALDTKSSQLNLPFKYIFSRNQSDQILKSHRRVKSNPLPVMAEKLDDDAVVVKKDTTRKKKRKVLEATISNLDDYPQEDYSVYLENSENNIDKGDRLLNLPASIPNDTLDDDTDTYSFDFSNKCITSQLETLNINLGNDKILDEELNSDINNNPSYTLKEHEEEEIHYTDDLLQDVVNECTKTSSNALAQKAADNRDTNVSLTSDLKSQDVDEERETFSISAGSTSEEASFQVGSESSKYLQIIAFDQESSRAVNDALAVVNASNLDPIFQINTAEGTDNANAAIDKYIPVIPDPSEPDAGNGLSPLSMADLKQAILTTGKRKDEVVESNRLLQCAFDEKQEELSLLIAEHESLKEDYEEKERINEKKVQDLHREIDVLKNQLKKYVTAVQLVRKEKISADEPIEVMDHSPSTTDDAHSLAESDKQAISENNRFYEDRLAQMAEMHGELMEFQESLQRILVHKDQQIELLKEQLISLRGPLPTNLESEDTSREPSDVLYSPRRKLINIWIPSVFLNDKGADSYHLYQVYLRIGDEEWNIYRRYSQFDKLNSRVCKLYPNIEKSCFPKKKVLRKKDNKLAEKRRQQLQEYLRKLINLLINSHAELATNSNKRKLIEIIPFFGETFNDDDKKKSSNGPVNISHYTGL